MYYELYIDVLFFMNFMMDSLLLLFLKTILKCPVTYGRVFLGGGIGSLLTCLIIAVPVPAAVKFLLFHTVVNTAMIKAGLNVKKGRDFLRAFVLLYAAAFFLGGILQALRPYVRTGSLFFAAAVASYYVLTAVFRFLIRIQKLQKQICEVTLFVDAREYKTKALVDTGNVLTDPVSGDAVSVIDKTFARQIFPETKLLSGVRYISYRSVSGESIMPVLRIEKMCVHIKETHWISEPLIGICGEQISEHEDYQMILNPDILEE